MNMVLWLRKISLGLGFLFSISLPVAACSAQDMLLYLPLVETPGARSESSIWQPAPGLTWDWQLSDPIDLNVDVAVIDLDLFETDAPTVTDLHGQGRNVICYISVGSWEKGRPDSADFPEAVLGNVYEGYPNERWIDVRRIDLLGPIMATRFDLCKEKGFDAVEPDNIDGYQNETGFPLSAADQLRYNRWLAEAAHARGLSIGLKNDPDQVADLVAYFDWALTEDCFDQGWCSEMQPFVAANKAVFAAEYTDTGITLDDFCGEAAQLRFSAILKDRSLDRFRRACG